MRANNVTPEPFYLSPTVMFKPVTAAEIERFRSGHNGPSQIREGGDIHSDPSDENGRALGHFSATVE